MAAPRRWIRLDVGWSDSEWLVALEPAARLAWVEMLVYVKTTGLAGEAKALPPAVFGRNRGIPPEAVQQMLEAAVGDGALTIAERTWTIVNWPEYQETDVGAAERMRQYRADRSRLSTTRQNRASHSRRTRKPVTPVTAPKPYDVIKTPNVTDVTGCSGVTRHATGTETGTETTDERITTEREGAGAPPPAIGKSKPAKPERWTVVPDTWKGPTAAHRTYALEHGLDLVAEVTLFTTHEWPPAKAKSDPDRTFTSWLARAAQWASERRLGRQNSSGNGRTQEAADQRLLQHRAELGRIDLNASRSVFDHG